MEIEAGEHVLTFPVIFPFFPFIVISAEKIESNHFRKAQKYFQQFWLNFKNQFIIWIVPV